MPCTCSRMSLAEGLFLNMPVTSSLVTVTSYQNASVYLDLSSNTGFKSFKVYLIIPLLLYKLIHDWLLCIPQISVYQFSSGLNDFGSELSDWNKAAFNLSNVGHHVQSPNDIFSSFKLTASSDQQHCHCGITSWQAAQSGCASHRHQQH
jgi:hypothetical protein